jgi:hypothetical protein
MNDMNSDQVFVSMTQFPVAWYEVPLVYIKKETIVFEKLSELIKMKNMLL